MTTGRFFMFFDRKNKEKPQKTGKSTFTHTENAWERFALHK